MNTEVNAKALLKILRKRKLPDFQSIEEVCKFVTKFMMKQYNLQHEGDINHGYCFIWAYLVWALHKEQVHFATTDGHVLVDYNGLYYDSSNPDGYECLEDADVDSDEAAYVNVNGMAWYWARCGVEKKKFRSILSKSFNRLYNRIRVGGFGDGDLWYQSDLCVEDIP